MKVPSLQSSSRTIVVRMLWMLVKRDPSQRCVPLVYKYLISATPHLMDIAHAACYHKRAILTEIFLPILIEKGKLYVTNANIDNIVSYWRENDSVNLSSMTHVKVGDLDGSQGFHFLPFLGHLTNLRILDIGCFVDDELLAVLGMNCPNLEIFDAREGMANTVTDIGLSYLSQCKKLRRILFSSFADEYAPLLDKLRLHGSGIALLLLSLPNIEQVLCSEYLLRDALNFLYQTSYRKRTIPLKCIFLDHPEVAMCNTLIQILPLWCPNIEVLTLQAINNKEKIIGNSLKLLTKLKILVLNMSSGCNFSYFNFSSFGAQLVYLQITSHLIASQDLLILSMSCPNLKTLGLKMYSYGFDGILDDKSVDAIFPSVEKLELLQNVSVRLYKFLSICMKNLKEVYSAWAHVHDLEKAVKDIVQLGGWKNVSLLVLPVLSPISPSVAKMLTDDLPNLTCLGITLDPSQEEELCKHVQHHLRNVSLVDQDDIASPSNSGIFSQNLWVQEIG